MSDLKLNLALCRGEARRIPVPGQKRRCDLMKLSLKRDR